MICDYCFHYMKSIHSCAILKVNEKPFPIPYGIDDVTCNAFNQKVHQNPNKYHFGNYLFTFKIKQK